MDGGRQPVETSQIGAVVVAVASVGVLLGGLLPWVHVGPLTVVGDLGDGAICSGCALAALCAAGLVLIGVRPVPLFAVAMLCLFGAATVAIVDGRHLQNFLSTTAADPTIGGGATVSPGLWMTAICAVVGGVGSLFSAAMQPLGGAAGPADSQALQAEACE